MGEGQDLFDKKHRLSIEDHGRRFFMAVSDIFRNAIQKKQLLSIWIVIVAGLMTIQASAVFASGGEEGGGGGITVIPDASVIIQIINFLFLIWVLNLIIFKPIRNILIQRKEKFL